MISLRHNWLWIAIGVALVLGVIWGSLQPAPQFVVPNGFDKVEHFGSYMILTLWFTGLYPRSRYWAVVVALLALGVAMEAGQYLMHMGRTADPYDVAANTAGIALGTVLAVLACGRWIARIDAWLS